MNPCWQRLCFYGAVLNLVVLGAGACGRTPLIELGSRESVAEEVSTRAQGGQANNSIGQGGAPTRPLQGSPCADLDGEWTWVPTVTPLDDFPLPGAGSQNPIGLRLTPSGEVCTAEFLPDWSTPWVRTLTHVPDGLTYEPPIAGYVEASAIWCLGRELAMDTLAIDATAGPEVRGEGRQTDYYGDEGIWRNIALQGRLTRGLPPPQFAAVHPTDYSHDWCSETGAVSSVGGLLPWQRPTVHASQVAERTFPSLASSVDGHAVDMTFQPVSDEWLSRKHEGIGFDYTQWVGKTLLVNSQPPDSAALRFEFRAVPLEPRYEGALLSRLVTVGQTERVTVGTGEGLRLYVNGCDAGDGYAAGRLDVTDKQRVVVVTRAYTASGYSLVELFESFGKSLRLEPDVIATGTVPDPLSPESLIPFEDRKYTAPVTGQREVGIQVGLLHFCDRGWESSVTVVSVAAE